MRRLWRDFWAAFWRAYDARREEAKRAEYMKALMKWEDVTIVGTWDYQPRERTPMAGKES